jgi:hypothetical protein
MVAGTALAHFRGENFASAHERDDIRPPFSCRHCISTNIYSARRTSAYVVGADILVRNASPSSVAVRDNGTLSVALATAARLISTRD